MEEYTIREILLVLVGWRGGRVRRGVGEHGRGHILKHDSASLGATGRCSFGGGGGIGARNRQWHGYNSVVGW